MEFTGDEYINLLAAVVRVAIADARRGDARAVKWLDDVFPSWQRHADWLRPRKARCIRRRAQQEVAGLLNSPN